MPNSEVKINQRGVMVDKNNCRGRRPRRPVLCIIEMELKRMEVTTDLIKLLQERFAKNMHRHVGINWPDVQAKLAANPEKLLILKQMEATGGEPDVIGYDEQAAVYIFCDCSAESPAGRRNLCYDDAALAARKEHQPGGSVLGMAEAMGVQLLTEAEYRALQELGSFDTKTSSWVVTPPAIRALGGALFCDRRYNHVFTYHNGAESYYGSRGFRGLLKA